jgi:hypothetical protein
VSTGTAALIDRKHMIEMLHSQPKLNEQFLAHMLLARYGTEDSSPQRVVPIGSQEALAGSVGTTRSRVNFFMNEFRKLGVIE